MHRQIYAVNVRELERKGKMGVELPGSSAERNALLSCACLSD